MKKLFLSLLLAASALAADPVVVVNSATNVTVNGSFAGTVVDALANNPNLPNIRARLLDAWLAYEQALIAASAKNATANVIKKMDDLKVQSDARIADAQKRGSDDAEKRAADALARAQNAERRALAAESLAAEHSQKRDEAEAAMRRLKKPPQ